MVGIAGLKLELLGSICTTAAGTDARPGLSIWLGLPCGENLVRKELRAAPFETKQWIVVKDLIKRRNA